MTINALEEGLYDKLAAASGVTGLVSTRIYRQVAPPDTAHPLIIFQHQGGGDDNLTPDDSINSLYLVKGISGASADQAGDVADAVRSALHGQTLTVTGWTNFWLAAEQAVRFTEVDASTGKLFWHAGHFYRVRLD